MQRTTYCLSELKGLGWSPALIAKLLPEPALKRNPMFACTAPMKLWNISDVEKAMQTQEFQDHLAKHKERQKAAQKAVETKKQKARQELERVKESIEVEVIGKSRLRKETINAKRDWFWSHDNFDDPRQADEATQQRWMVNYIRHNLTTYEDGLYEIYGKTGKDELYSDLKECVLEKIAEAYPYLADECYSQINYMQFGC